MSRQTAWLFTFSLLPLAAAGCQSEPTAAPAPKPPEVKVSSPVLREVTDYELFTGRSEASERAELRSRVTGELEKSYFTEGALVQEDDLLFVIDARPFRAEVAKATASLEQARVQYQRLERDHVRAQAMFTRQAMGREEFERIAGDRDVARAAIQVAESSLKLAQLNLAYTDIKAPFSGRISRRMIDPGNLVRADETVLTTLVALEPTFVYFDVDERTVLRQMLREGPHPTAASEKVTIQVGLADEDGFPHQAAVDFIDNRVDPSTGTMWMRGVFVNPKRPIPPGLFCRIRFPLGNPYQAVMVAEQALGTDQGRKFVYVVDEHNKVVYRPVQVGRLHEGLRVIREGLKPTETVVVSGLQRARAGTEVSPKPVGMLGLVESQPAQDSPQPPKR